MINCQIGYVAVSNAILKTIDGGLSWFEIPSPLSQGAKGIEVISETEVYSFIGTEIYLSEDSGQTWETISTGINTTINDIYPLGNNVCWAIGNPWFGPEGSSSGIYWSNQMPLSNDTSTLPVEISLNNYPNPFNPLTTISYTLTQATAVKLTIYDLNGKQIITLLNDWQAPGTHYVQWSTNDLSNGVYLSRLVTDDQIITGKMTLLK